MTATSPVEIRALGPSPDEARLLGELTVEAYLPLLGLAGSDPYLAELADVTRRAALAVVLVAVDGDGALLGGIT